MLKEQGDTSEIFSLFVFEPPIQEGSYMMGITGLYIHDFEDDLGITNYSLFIEYEDLKNSNFSKEKILIDL